MFYSKSLLQLKTTEYLNTLTVSQFSCIHQASFICNQRKINPNCLKINTQFKFLRKKEGEDSYIHMHIQIIQVLILRRECWISGFC